MPRPYGKKPKRSPARKSARASGNGSAFKFKLRRRDDAALTMTDVQQGLYEIARELAPLKNYRAGWATLFLTVLDENGREVLLDPSGEKTIFPYKSAADEFGA